MDMMQLYECWSKVVGYRNAAEGQYAVPDMMESHTAVFRYGIWDTEADSGEGMVTELQASGEQELTALVYYAALEATELRDAVEETTISVVIDYSGLEQDARSGSRSVKQTGSIICLLGILHRKLIRLISTILLVQNEMLIVEVTV